MFTEVLTGLIIVEVILSIITPTEAKITNTDIVGSPVGLFDLLWLICCCVGCFPIAKV